MLGTYASAAFVCVGALVLGQEVLRLCAATRWSWTAALVGPASMLVIVVTVPQIPRRAAFISNKTGINGDRHQGGAA